MQNSKIIKLYKNPDRTKASETVKPYVPQYQLLGAEPEEYKSSMSTVVIPSPSEEDNPRLRKPGLRQPYAVAEDSPVGRGKGFVPNVGNNMEHTWAGVDGDIIDDLSGITIDKSSKMIDNNDFIANEQLPELDEVLNPPRKIFSKEEKVDDLLLTLSSLDSDSYLLIVDDVPVCSGPLPEIQDQARALVFGEHELCDGKEIDVEKLLIVKRVKIKMGLFLE